MDRVIAIGDVHGCSSELNELLTILKVSSSDQIIFIGDLVNRGPDTRGVLDRVYQLENATFVVGNHELSLLKHKESNGKTPLKEYAKKTFELLDAKDWQFLKAMKPYHYEKTLNTVFVHGGFLPHLPWEEQSLDVITRIQVIDKKGMPKKFKKCPTGRAWTDFWNAPPYVVYGHWPKAQVQPTAYTLGIDTACVYGGKLTAVEFPEKKIIQVPAKKAYI